MTKKQKEWTEGRKKSFVTSVLRSGSRRWPPKYECLAAAYKETKTNEKTGRLAKHFECNTCKQLFPSKDVQVDHIQPIVGPEGFVSWDVFINRLYCPIDNLQVLCKPCHDEKTQREKPKRKKKDVKSK